MKTQTSTLSDTIEQQPRQCRNTNQEEGDLVFQCLAEQRADVDIGGAEGCIRLHNHSCLRKAIRLHRQARQREVLPTNKQHKHNTSHKIRSNNKRKKRREGGDGWEGKEEKKCHTSRSTFSSRTISLTGPRAAAAAAAPPNTGRSGS